MKRATVTFPDALEQKLEAYLSRQRTPPSLSTVVQVALDEYLETQKWAEYDIRPARGTFNLTVSEEGSTDSDVSLNHHSYSADAVYERKVARAHQEPKAAEGSVDAIESVANNVGRESPE